MDGLSFDQEWAWGSASWRHPFLPSIEMEVGRKAGSKYLWFTVHCMRMHLVRSEQLSIGPNDAPVSCIPYLYYRPRDLRSRFPEL